MKYDEEILNLLEQNARLSVEDIAAMTKKSPDEVKGIIKQMEDEGIILKYGAVINKEKLNGTDDKVRVHTTLWSSSKETRLRKWACS